MKYTLSKQVRPFNFREERILHGVEYDAAHPAVKRKRECFEPVACGEPEVEVEVELEDEVGDPIERLADPEE